MSARENILARIRQQSGRSGITTEAELQSVRDHITKKTRGPLPSIAHEEPIKRFIRACEQLKSSVEEVPSLRDAPLALARYLEQNSLEKRVVGWPSLFGAASVSANAMVGDAVGAAAELDWAAAGIAYAARIANADDLVGVTGCFCAIGETGSLLLLSSSTTPKLNALLPETHICILSKARIVATMEDAFALLRAEVGALPRSTFIVSGPSRTADIEQTIVIGAHGPYRVHIILTP